MKGRKNKMKLSRLELERFILGYEDYKKSADTTLWFEARSYLERFDIPTDLIEYLVDMKVSQDKIEGILTILEVEIV